ncbi:histone deacetylase 2 [Arachis duranensis]|uniref:histone deacetylase n=1 Tax=Arachis duranensis TaxID=130453 RepID=A0A9C6TYB6_ARADU|nr:histone deacetylase 2 [Arachis duranensis]
MSFTFIQKFVTESTRFPYTSAFVLAFITVAVAAVRFRRLSKPTSFTMSSSSVNDPVQRNRIFSSKLYFDVPRSKVPIIYSESYDISFLGIEKLHPFDSSKWGRVCRFLVSFGVLDKKCIVEPLEASKDDLLVHVNTFCYMEWKMICELKVNFLTAHLSEEEKVPFLKNVATIIEVPPVGLFPNCLVQQKVLHPFRKQVGGTILSAKLAKERGWAINVGGGFHHCSAEKGGGFCAYADISLCIHFALVRLNISRVMIIDLDAHQGNGHETDFAYDSRVYILDMYNPGIYPLDYEARNYINQKVEVKSGTLTEDYLQKLDEALEVAGRSFDPELIVYNAGTDILDGDPLGRLKISPDGITLRDEKVFRFAREKNIPIVMLTSGGYMKSSARVIADSIVNLSKKCLIEDKQDS